MNCIKNTKKKIKFGGEKLLKSTVKITSKNQKYIKH